MSICLISSYKLYLALFSQPVFVELLQLLDAVSRMASLGFEKSYREAVVLMTRSYMSKLSDVGSAESKTQASEATTERIEVCLLLQNIWLHYPVRRRIVL